MSFSPPPRNSIPPPQAQPQPQSSQEDGEIFSPPPPKAPPLAPRSHTPPTHPRSFYTARGDISPTRRSPPPSSARRPLHPTQYSRTQGPPRLAPSAPRALREGIGYVPSPLYGGGGGVQNAPYFAPRGPSADRDRDRGRDWGRDRGDSERAWIPGPSRGRGRGTWGR
uniref:Cytochrome P450 monooxygenase CYP52X1 n=1 Tax=Ganoderma boninense TaxID=34458 RepID=A0A5K1K7H7_9APHY|nr:Cytochrome P450 monooxygenase CYP52X1 [Ganoderma boninense]